MDHAPDLLNVFEVAALLRVHYSTVYRHIYAGRLAAYKIGGNVRVSRDELDRFLADSLTTSQLEPLAAVS